MTRRRHRVPKLHRLCQRHFGLTTRQIQDLIDDPDNQVPTRHQVDPRAIESCLHGPSVPTLCVVDNKFVLTREDYRGRRRLSREEAAEDQRDYLLHLQGLRTIDEIARGIYSESCDSLWHARLARDRWLIGRQKARHRLDDILTLPATRPQEHYPDIFPGAAVGVTWHASKSPGSRKSPSATRAAAKAILSLCPFVPAPPFPDFQDIEGREQGNRILRYLEAELEELCHQRLNSQ